MNENSLNDTKNSTKPNLIHKPQSEARASIYASIKSTSQRSKTFNFNNFLLVIYIEIRALLVYEPRPHATEWKFQFASNFGFFLPSNQQLCVCVLPLFPLWLSTAPPTVYSCNNNGLFQIYRSKVDKSEPCHPSSSPDSFADIPEGEHAPIATQKKTRKEVGSLSHSSVLAVVGL